MPDALSTSATPAALPGEAGGASPARPRRSLVALVGALVTVAVVLGACGSSTSPTSTGSPAAGNAGSGRPTTSVSLPAAIAHEPTVTVPPAPLPTTLQVTDLVTGTGQTAATGQTLTVNYVGALASNGKVFDASWTNGNGPISFVLGAGQVIPGWDQGLVGMKVGGRRQLVIPPNLAYGTQANGPIPPDSTLVFVVDLIKVS